LDFIESCDGRNPTWKFNQSMLFLEFLMGKRAFKCTPWGMPTYSIVGWQKPCYLLQDGYADTFNELNETTEWTNYGTESGNPQCANCMVHSGYEASGVDYTFGSLRGLMAATKATLFTKNRNSEALLMLNEQAKPVHSYNPLVQVQTNRVKVEQTRA